MENNRSCRRSSRMLTSFASVSASHSLPAAVQPFVKRQSTVVRSQMAGYIASTFHMSSSVMLWSERCGPIRDATVAVATSNIQSDATEAFTTEQTNEFVFFSNEHITHD